MALTAPVRWPRAKDTPLVRRWPCWSSLHWPHCCSESALDADLSECQGLSHGTACCFEDDAGKDCAVYAGCVALIKGKPVDATEEDEE